MRHKIFLPIVMVLLLALVVLPTVAQDTPPKAMFPQLSGEYEVGQTMRAITDPSRDEVFTEDTSDKRTLAVTFYYPADPDANAEPAPYMTEAEGQGFSAVMGIPPALTS